MKRSEGRRVPLLRLKEGGDPVTRNRNGFTLIELLVVITIIGVLMAMLFPAVISALSSADETQCQSNLSQLAKVVIAYCEDNEGRFPLFATEDRAGSTNDWLYVESSGHNDVTQGLLMRYKYIGDEDILYCPDDPGRDVRPATVFELEKRSDDISNTFTEIDPPSYVINASITWGNYDQWSTEPVSQVRSRNISEFDPVDFLFIEQSAGVNPEPSSRFDQAYMTPQASQYALTNRHREGGFVSCMDGHVEWFTFEKFRDGMQALQRDNSANNWYYKTPERPSSTPDRVISDEEVGARWNPG